MPDLTSILYTVALCLALVMLSLYITVKRLPWLINHRAQLIGITVVLGVAVYCIGYLSNGYTDQGWLKGVISGLLALFSTGRMFVLENDIGEITGASGSPVYMAIFGTVMIFAMFSVVMVVLSFFGYRFISRLRIFFLRILRNPNDFYIFTDLNEDTFELARNIRRAQPKSNILFCADRKAQDDNEKRLEGMAAAENFILQTVADSAGPGGLQIFKASKKSRINYIICNEQLSLNAQTASRIAGYLQNAPSKEKTSLFVYTDYDRYEYAFNSPVFNGVNIITVDRNALASYQLFQRLQLISCASARISGGKAQGTLTVAVAGFCTVTPHLYRDIAAQSQLYGLKAKIIAIDEGITDKIAPFLYSNPQIGRCIRIDTIPAAVNSKEFYKLIDSELSGIDVFICCCRDDEQSLLAAKSIQQRIAARDLHTRVCAHAGSSREAGLLAADPVLKNIEVFGSDDLIRSADAVINGRLDQMAEAVHGYYCQSYGDATPWRHTSIYDRQSSRALALNIPAKLASVGMALTDKPGVGPYTELLAAEPDTLHNLAISEHMRWNAYLFCNGWTQEPFEGVYLPKDAARKSHQCLTGWDELAEISKAAGRDFQKLDRDLVEHVGDIVSRAGLGITYIRKGQ